MPLGEIITERGRNLYLCSSCSCGHVYEEDARDCCTWHCQSCDEMYESEEEAEDCCMYYCPSCQTQHSTDEDAYNCCLDEPTPSDYIETMAGPYSYPSSVLETIPEHL